MTKACRSQIQDSDACSTPPRGDLAVDMTEYHAIGFETWLLSLQIPKFAYFDVKACSFVRGDE